MQGLVLIVEDEADLVATLEYNLQREGYQTRSALTGEAAMVAVKRAPQPDVILLDLQLPDMAGTEVCRRIRADADTKDIPVIMVTAKGSEIDRVVGFEVGADDYVVKPFSVRELMLRVRAQLRRKATANGEATADGAILEFGWVRVDQEAHRAWVKGTEVTITALEFKLLVAFLSRRGRVQTRESLLSDVWGIDAEVTTRTVDTHVKRLREKLGDAGAYIETLRGVGYRFKDSLDEASA